ncbi:DAM1 DASH complex subunit DAM1 [Candida maltosa Xu316]|uniref:DASH complex subunit DAM1 n=1 Tax=Candida maltosa (strain Xu316) TaxID=1245528 RepID=M3K4E2_CANMX|nr:hypothetical protein G210_5590 [Candida maltosa Xu316]
MSSSSSKPTTPNNRHYGRRYSRRSSGAQLQTTSPKINHYPIDADNLPMDSEEISGKFKNIAESMGTLDQHMDDFQTIHNNISNRFNESFASFLYGLSMTMWCVDFTGYPKRGEWEAIAEAKQRKERIRKLKSRLEHAEELNKRLKSRLSEETKHNPLPSNESRFAKPAVRPTRSVSYKGVSTTNIAKTTTPNPIRSTASSRLRQSSTMSKIPQLSKDGRQATRQSRNGPNLNQKARYMSGLFDGSNTSNTTGNYGGVKKPVQRKPPTSLANRPPFR